MSISSNKELMVLIERKWIFNSRGTNGLKGSYGFHTCSALVNFLQITGPQHLLK